MNSKEIKAEIDKLEKENVFIEWSRISQLSSLKNVFKLIDPRIDELELGIKNVRRTFGEGTYEFTFEIFDKNEKFHWAGQIVAIDFELTKTEIETNLNCGSGGWNDIDTDVILNVFEHAIRCAKQSIYTVKAAHSKVFSILKNYDKISTLQYKLTQKMRSLESQLSEENTQKKIDKIMRSHVLVNGKKVVKTLEDKKINKRIDCIKVSYSPTHIIIRPTSISLKHNKTKRFYIDGISVSKKFLCEGELDNFYHVNDSLDGSSDINYGKFEIKEL